MNKQRLNEVEKFLNDKEVTTKIFSNQAAILEPNYGNPDVTSYDADFIKKLKEEYNQVLLTSDIEQPANIKVYKPRKSTIDELRTIKAETIYAVRRHIKTISPFPIHSRTKDQVNMDLNYMRGSIEDVLETIVPFKYERMYRMEHSVREEVFDAILSAIKNILREYRGDFFIKGFAFEEDFEVNKLKYLIEEGERPIVLSEDNYDFLEEIYIKAVRMTLDNLFKIAYEKKEGKVLFKDLAGEEFYLFNVECAKRFSYLNRAVISSLASSYTYSGLYENELKDEVIKEHDLIKTTQSVIIEDLKILKEKTQYSSWMFHFRNVSAIEPKRLHRFVKNDGIQFVMDDTMSYIKAVLGNEKNGIFSLPDKYIEDIENEYKKEVIIKTFYARLHSMFNYITKQTLK